MAGVLTKEIFDPMDVSLFQFSSAETVSFPRLERLLGQRTARSSTVSAGSPAAGKAGTEDSVNLDVLRSFAVLLVVGFHLAKFFNWRLATLRVTDFGLLGVMFFFVHTTLVLMFSLERQHAAANGPLFLPFMVRRCFRIYPLAILTVIFVYLFHIPSDLQVGGFHLLRQTAGNLLANILLVQNISRQPASPGVLWSLPLELQMYLALPALFILALRTKAWWAMVALWAAVVALWLAVGQFAGMLPLSETGIRSPWEALLKFTRFVPCFLPGLVAYKLWRRPRIFPAVAWIPFLGVCCAAFLYYSGGSAVQFGWLICLAIGVGAAMFREMPANWFARVAKRVARYSYGIYLLHYFAIWLAFEVLRERAAWTRIAVFVVVLTALPALLYHTLEAPLIRTGVRLSRASSRWQPATAMLVLILSILFSAPWSARAQSTANRAAASSVPSRSSEALNQRLEQAFEKLPGSVDTHSAESTIGPDDLLNISVFEAPELNCTARVTTSGEISMQLLGAVHAAGLTPRELETSLEGRLQRTYLKNPHVGVFVQELQSHAVSVVGAVKAPGVFQIRGSKSLVEMLSLAQGLADDAGDIVLIMRSPSDRPSSSNKAESVSAYRPARVFPSFEPASTGDASAGVSSLDRSAVAPPANRGEIVEINLKKLLESPDAALNVPVHPGDIVKVPRAGIVYVVGEVVKPGGFVLQNNESISVLQALALAQGPTHTSAIGRARIIRTDSITGARTEIPANLGRIFSGKAPDTFLQAKDVVFVPNSAAKSVLYRSSEAALQTAAGVAIYKW